MSRLGVLLCDDAPEMLDLLRSHLENDPGLRVVGEASDGEAVLRLAAQRRPDVVLLDLQMPGPAAGDVALGVHRLAPDAAIMTFSGFGPERLTPEAAEVVALHVPKTTDLAVVRRLVREVGARARRAKSAASAHSGA